MKDANERRHYRILDANHNGKCSDNDQSLLTVRNRGLPVTRWELLDTADIPRNGGQLRLLRRGDEFSIRISGSQGDLKNF